ncbi:uncharacterized protein BT62DRAFT_999302 [Guyanagaster necrorhizus]|uniref:Uncharacterized protein n=1 Tax=Guyanagaster necrorhizus TaxID=856835 RepID=A0A9P7W619_9AGAR|nr:uncharacterized protein BT62DRAFT_999302 [Guyanagaster necrorhizus MCA 3950]KAG7453249.1 hypothetical protein BT62DRAFT_999302 [Guyanagaster necrorhizus MCA 3950]
MTRSSDKRWMRWIRMGPYRGYLRRPKIRPTDLTSTVPYRRQQFWYGLQPYCYSRIHNRMVHIPSRHPAVYYAYRGRKQKQVPVSSIVRPTPIGKVNGQSSTLRGQIQQEQEIIAKGMSEKARTSENATQPEYERMYGKQDSLWLMAPYSQAG